MTTIDTLRTRKAPRRRAVSMAAAAVVAAAVAGCDTGDRSSLPPTTPSASSAPSTSSAWKAAPDGTQYVVAPPLGTESTLGLYGPSDVPPTIDPTATRRELADVIADDKKSPPFVVAVFLEATGGADYADAASFQPVFVLKDGSQVNSGLTLDWVSDREGNRSFPLSVDGAVIAKRVAFPQPGGVVVLDLRTGKNTTVPVPSPSIERVRSVGGALVASGDDGAWVVDLGSADLKAVKAPAGYTGADESITVDPEKGASLTSWKLGGRKRTRTALTAPVTSTTGQTLSNTLTAATAVTLDNVDGVSAKQGILAVSLVDPTARRLLVMGETPARQKVCCQVVGFMQKDLVVYSSTTADGVWLLVWNTRTGANGRTLLLEANPAVPPVISWGLSFDRF